MSNIIPEGFGSTALNGRIETYGDLVYRTKSLLGWPSVPIELTDVQWAHIIDKAIEDFTEFEGNREEEYLVFCSNLYKRGCGVKLDDLLPVACNTQHCFQTIATETITSTYLECEDIQTTTAYLSVTPFEYPTEFNYLDPLSVAYSGTSGQDFFLYFDPKNPWDAINVCEANCVTINPVSSQYFQISANINLSSHVFDFIGSEILSTVLSTISSDISSYSFDSVPISGLGNLLSAIPIEYYDLSAFYSGDIMFGPPMSACIDIGRGRGFVYPNCDTASVLACNPLTAQYGVSPLENYILTSVLLTAFTTTAIAILSSYFDICETDVSYSCISSYIFSACDLGTEDDLSITTEDGNILTINCSSSSVSGYYFELFKPILSSYNLVYDLSALDISDATHLRLYGVPSCTTDGSIPLDSNNGILGTFTLCNTAFSTNGPMTLEKIQFFKDNKPPIEVLYEQNCAWTNNGFTFSYHNSSYTECVRATPSKVKVDVTFSNCSTITEVGVVSTVTDSGLDEVLNRRRKVLGVFAADNAGQGGYFGGGGDLLFNFDYALMANTFGYDLMGNRNMLGKQGYDLLTYHMARDFVDHSKKMLRYVSYQFNPRTQYLKVTPEPAGTTFAFESSCCENNVMRAGSQCYVLGVYIEPSVETLLSTYFIKEYVMALAMITLGRIRSTFGGVTLYGGATLDGTQLAAKGEEKAEKLLVELRDEFRYSSPSGFLIG